MQLGSNNFAGCARFVLGVCSEGMGVDPAWFYELCDPIKGEIPHSASDPMGFERDLPDDDATSATVLRLMQYHHLTEPAVETDGTKAEHNSIGRRN